MPFSRRSRFIRAGAAGCRRLVPGLVILLALATSCGGSDSPPSGEASTTTVSVTTSSSSSTPGTAPSSSVDSTPSTAGDEVQTVVWFSTGDGSDCGAIAPFRQTIAATGDQILQTLEQLVSGPNDDDAEAGAQSMFSRQTREVISAIELRDDTLVVDFIELPVLIPNASTSCGSQALLAQLNQTTLQFDEVERVRYTLNGSCDAFGNWLQRECVEFTAEGETVADLTTNERASGSGCMPGSETLDDGRWFGQVSSVSARDISFDLACWFVGTAAKDAAEEDGEESPPPNDYYIRNSNDQIRTIPVANDAAVRWMPSPGDPATTAAISFTDWSEERTGRPFQPAVWLTIADGVVRSIEEQYQP